MKILLVHDKYKQPGGEDIVFESEGDLLSKNGHFVERLVFDNSTISTFVDRFLSGLKAIYNPESARTLRKKIESFNPDIIHVHNFFPLVSPSIFFVAKKFNIPIILTLHKEDRRRNQWKKIVDVNDKFFCNKEIGRAHV